MTAGGTLDRVLLLLANADDRRYGGEALSQLAHGLQTAELAETHGAAPSLIAASLLHDIGHLLGDGEESALAVGIDAQHETAGANFLGRWFGAAVTEPIRLHVPAKRYLCATEPGYWAALSPVSKRSLAVQGGAFDAREAAAFLQKPHAAEAIQLRRWDEQAKRPDHEPPALAHFRTLIAPLVVL